LRAEASPQRLIFGDDDLDNSNYVAESGLYVLKDKTRELFAGRNQFAISELGYIEIDVAMIESLADFDAQDVVEHPEVDEHSRFVCDGSGHCDFTGVTVPMKALTRTASKDALVLFVGPIRSSVAMGGCERDSAREEGRHGEQLQVPGARCQVSEIGKAKPKYCHPERSEGSRPTEIPRYARDDSWCLAPGTLDRFSGLPRTRHLR